MRDRTLFSLSLARNFSSFIWNGDIPSGQEVGVFVPEAPGKMPDSFLILDSEGTRDIVRGGLPWSQNFISLLNNSPMNCTRARILILYGTFEGR